MNVMKNSFCSSHRHKHTQRVNSHCESTHHYSFSHDVLNAATTPNPPYDPILSRTSRTS